MKEIGDYLRHRIHTKRYLSQQVICFVVLVVNSISCLGGTLGKQSFKIPIAKVKNAQLYVVLDSLIEEVNTQHTKKDYPLNLSCWFKNVEDSCFEIEITNNRDVKIARMIYMDKNDSAGCFFYKKTLILISQDARSNLENHNLIFTSNKKALIKVAARKNFILGPYMYVYAKCYMGKDGLEVKSIRFERFP